MLFKLCDFFAEIKKKIYIRGKVIFIEILNHFGQPCIILTQDYVLAVYFSLLESKILKKIPLHIMPGG